LINKRCSFSSSPAFSFLAAAIFASITEIAKVATPVSRMPVPAIVKGALEHHRTKTFEDEYIAFLKLHDIAFERRYLFEAEHYG
jgi:hypothetical protein